MKNKTLILIIISFVVGCASDRAHWAKIDAQRKGILTAIESHKSVSDKINLGDTRENILPILLPTQDSLKPYPVFQKSTDKYIKNDVLVEIYFMRSGWFRDSLTTDDEFTPYVFNDGKLIGVGWTILGGPSTHGQTIPTTNVETTIINQPPIIQIDPIPPLPFPRYKPYND
jgi:hypothetical protein